MFRLVEMISTASSLRSLISKNFINNIINNVKKMILNKKRKNSGKFNWISFLLHKEKNIMKKTGRSLQSQKTIYKR